MISAFVIYAKKKISSIWGKAHNDLFSVQIGSKKQFLRGFANFF